jgi:hypothetical protein
MLPEQKSSIAVGWANSAYKAVPMVLIYMIKQWDAHALFTGERPVWWQRVLIRIVVGTKYPKKGRL